jgi:hypothetical protein
MKPLKHWENNKYYIMFWVCVCSLSYLACKTHVPYCINHLWPAWLYLTGQERYILTAIVLDDKSIVSVHCYSAFLLSLQTFGRNMLNPYCTLNMEAVCSPKVLYASTRCHNKEDNSTRFYHIAKLRSCLSLVFSCSSLSGCWNSRELKGVATEWLQAVFLCLPGDR